MSSSQSPRVVSLLPSATELLCAIAGGSEMLVGRSHECDVPAAVGDRPTLTSARTRGVHAGGDSASIDAEVRVVLGSDGGGPQSLYTLDEARLRELRPDVILTQDLCAVCSIDLGTVRRIAASMDPVPTIVSLNPASIEDVFDDLLRVGAAVGLDRAAEVALVALRESYWSAIDFVNPYVDGPEVLFLEWIEPPFVAGHWTPQLIEAAGGRHSLNPAGAKSRVATPEEIVAAQPQRVIVCPCGLDLAAIRTEMPRLEATKWWRALPAVADGQVALVDGNLMFSRPGPRLVDAFRWLVAWINDRPEVVPNNFPAERWAPDAALKYPST